MRVRLVSKTIDSLFSIPVGEEFDMYKILESITHRKNGKLLAGYAIRTVLSLQPQECINDCSYRGKVEYEKDGKKGNICTDSLSVKQRWSCEPYRKFLSKEIERAEIRFRKSQNRRSSVFRDLFNYLFK